MTDTTEACLYLLKAGYTPFSHAFVDASQAHIVMRGNNQLQIAGRVIFPYLKGDPEPTLDPATTTPSPFGDNTGDPQLPAALQGASPSEGNQSPQQQPPHAPMPIRRLQPIDRWAPQTANDASRQEQSTYTSPPTTVSLPEPTPTQLPGYQSRMTIPTTFRSTPNTTPTPTPAAPQPTFSSTAPHGPGRSRYPDPGPTPVMAPPSPVAATASDTSPNAMPPAQPNPSPLRRSTRERTSVVPHNATKPGSDGGGLMKHHT